MGVTTDQCRSMGTSTSLRVLSDGAWAFWSMPVWRMEIYDKPTLVHGSRWVVTKDAGAWQLWGTPEADEFAAATLVQLPILPPAQGEA